MNLSLPTEFTYKLKQNSDLNKKNTLFNNDFVQNETKLNLNKINNQTVENDDRITDASFASTSQTNNTKSCCFPFFFFLTI